MSLLDSSSVAETRHHHSITETRHQQTQQQPLFVYLWSVFFISYRLKTRRHKSTCNCNAYEQMKPCLIYKRWSPEAVTDDGPHEPVRQTDGRDRERRESEDDLQ